MTAGGPVARATSGGLRFEYEFEYEIDWRLRARRMRAGGLWPRSDQCVHYGSLNHGRRHHQPTGAEPVADPTAAPAAAAPAAAAHQRHRDALLAGADHQ